MSTRTSKRKLEQLTNNNNNNSSSSSIILTKNEQLQSNKKVKSTNNKIKVKVEKETKSEIEKDIKSIDKKKQKTSTNKSKSNKKVDKSAASTTTSTSSSSSSSCSSQSYINYDPVTHTCTASTYDGKRRCWPTYTSNNVNMINYHDQIWGHPCFNTRELFESLSYQGFQAGLSWTIICSKLSTMKTAFDNFDYNKIINYKEKDIERLMQDSGIIRNRSKIQAIINNAKLIKEIEDTEEGGFVQYIWNFKPIHHDERYIQDRHRLTSHMRTDMQLKPKDRLYSDGVHPSISVGIMSDAMKKRGFKFVGPTIIISFMQAIGMMNHHYQDCHVYEQCEQEYKNNYKKFIKLEKQNDEKNINNNNSSKSSSASSKKKVKKESSAAAVVDDDVTKIKQESSSDSSASIAPQSVKKATRKSSKKK